VLSAGVAHEIDNPLSYVAGNLELLSKRLQDRFDDGELHGMLTEAARGVDRIRDIVRSLRTLSRMEEAEHRVPVDLREIVQVAARLAENKLRESLPLKAAKPRVPAPEQPPQPTASANEPPAAQTRARVLLIADDQHVTRMIGRALCDFDVTVVNESQDALGILAVESFDVILCDLMMPNITGIDLHRELTRAHPAQAQRMIFLTGGSFSAEADDFLTKVQNPWLQKPFATEALQRACRQMAHKHSGTHASGIKLRSPE
jgi:CheY-like chemotaxis protein